MGEVKNTRRDKILFALVIVGLILAFLLTFVIVPKMQANRAAESASTATPEAPAEAPAVQDNTQTSTPTPTKTYTGNDSDYDVKDEYKGFTSTTDRKPQKGDEAAAKKVIEEVMPRWAGIDLTGNGIAPDTWAKDVARPGGVNSAFTAWSQTKFYDELWGGVVQMRASAKVLDVNAEEELWNVGSHSMWRVSVKRAITNNSSGEEMTRETVSWDILVALDETNTQGEEKGEKGPLLAYFSETDKANKKPETFYLPPVPKH